MKIVSQSFLKIVQKSSKNLRRNTSENCHRKFHKNSTRHWLNSPRRSARYTIDLNQNYSPRYSPPRNAAAASWTTNVPRHWIASINPASRDLIFSVQRRMIDERVRRRKLGISPLIDRSRSRRPKREEIARCTPIEPLPPPPSLSPPLPVCGPRAFEIEMKNVADKSSRRVEARRDRLSHRRPINYRGN